MFVSTGKLIRASILVLVLFHFAKAQNNRIIVHVPTADEEISYIWQQLQDLSFFIENGYDLVLPEGKLMEELKEKVLNGTLGDQDFSRFETFFKQEIYNSSDYQKGFEKIEAQLDVLNPLVSELGAIDYEWDFKFYPTYDVILTLYGPGGSYNPDTGTIIIYTNSEGEFKGYPNPANTIIHEVVHIGIEESLIQKYQVPHTMKERMVDTMVSILFSEDLPGYRIQDMGDYRIDPYLSTVNDIFRLEQAIKVLTGN